MNAFTVNVGARRGKPGCPRVPDGRSTCVLEMAYCNTAVGALDEITHAGLPQLNARAAPRYEPVDVCARPVTAAARRRILLVAPPSRPRILLVAPVSLLPV